MLFEVALAVGSAIEPLVPRIIAVVHQSLVQTAPQKPTGKAKRKEAQEALVCPATDQPVYFLQKSAT